MSGDACGGTGSAADRSSRRASPCRSTRSSQQPQLLEQGTLCAPKATGGHPLGLDQLGPREPRLDPYGLRGEDAIDETIVPVHAPRISATRAIEVVQLTGEDIPRASLRAGPSLSSPMHRRATPPPSRMSRGAATPSSRPPVRPSCRPSNSEPIHAPIFRAHLVPQEARGHRHSPGGRMPRCRTLPSGCRAPKTVRKMQGRSGAHGVRFEGMLQHKILATRVGAATGTALESSDRRSLRIDAPERRRLEKAHHRRRVLIGPNRRGHACIKRRPCPSRISSKSDRLSAQAGPGCPLARSLLRMAVPVGVLLELGPARRRAEVERLSFVHGL